MKRKPSVPTTNQPDRLARHRLMGTGCQPGGMVRNVTVPIYFCHGMKDELVPWDQGQALFDAQAGPKWNWWVADANHYNVRQKNRDKYLRRLRVFLEERLR
jgi:fermentation-respiration switch protein FrsA (DUF1100 family)